MEGGVLMPLALAKTGEIQTIRKISGRDDTKRFLESLGFGIGDQRKYDRQCKRIPRSHQQIHGGAHHGIRK